MAMPGAGHFMSGEARRRRLRALLKRSGAPDVDPASIEPAFIHESAARESAGTSNERLEFFGDAILGLVAARYVFATYPLATEGELARRKNALVSGESCAQSARRLGFGELVVLGHGAQAGGGSGNTSILSDAFEAYIAALYGATDLPTVTGFIEREHLKLLDRIDLADADAKTALQELTQARFAAMPVYFERAEGPAHDRRFTSQVRVRDEVLGEGIGSSKKAAQLSAAAMALAALRGRTPPEAPPPAASNDSPSASSSDGRVIAFRARRKPNPKPKAPI
jgi:ribonuclease-3